MPLQVTNVLRVCRHVLMIVLAAALVVWLAASPLAWIVRDGLGPGMVETTGASAVVKFVLGWSRPGLALAAPLLALWIIERRSETVPAYGAMLWTEVARK